MELVLNISLFIDKIQFCILFENIFVKDQMNVCVVEECATNLNEIRLFNITKFFFKSYRNQADKVEFI